MIPIQSISIVTSGGTPMQLVDQRGAPYPTTGRGALVFNVGAHLVEPVIDGAKMNAPVFNDPIFNNGTFDNPHIVLGQPGQVIYVGSDGVLKGEAGLIYDEVLNTVYTSHLDIEHTISGETVIADVFAQTPLQVISAASFPQIQMEALGNPAEAKNWWLTVHSNGDLALQKLNDAKTLVINQIVFKQDGTIEGNYPAGVPSPNVLPTVQWVEDQIAATPPGEAPIDGTQYARKDAAWVAVTASGGPPTGPAGGALNGTYPNPGINPATTIDWTQIINEPATFPPSTHAHVTSDVTGLDTALAGKAPLVHTHTAASVTDFSEAVDDRVAALLVAGANVTLTYDDTANMLTVASTASGGAPTGPAGGDLTGNYPNPTLVGGPLSDYLPLTGGSISGNVAISGSLHVESGAEITGGLDVIGTLDFADANGDQVVTQNVVFKPPSDILTGHLWSLAIPDEVDFSLDLIATSDGGPTTTGTISFRTDGGVAFKTQAPGNDSTLGATTAFVTAAVAAGGGAPTGPAGGDLAGSYPNPTLKADVALTGSPTAPTPTSGDADTSIATTEFVTAAIAAIPPTGSLLTGFWTSNTGVTTPPPASGRVRISVVWPPSVGASIHLYIHNTDVDGFVYTWALGPNVGDLLVLRSASGARLDGTVTAKSTSTYLDVTITVTAVAGTLSNNSRCQIAAIQFVQNYLPLAGGTMTGPLAGTTAAFSGEITAATPATADNDTTVATTAFVKAQAYVTGGPYQPVDADLTALAALSTTGMMARTAANTYTMRTLTGTASRLSVTNGDGVAGNPTLNIDAAYDALWAPVGHNHSALYQPLDADLTALAGLSATAGLVEQTGAAAFTKRLIGVANATDVLTRAGGDGRYATTAHTHAGVYEPADATLTGLAALDTTTGMVEQTGATSFAKRALGVSAATSIPTRADADTRYAAASHTHTASQVTDFSEAVDDRVGSLLTAGTNVTLNYNDAAGTLTINSTSSGGPPTGVAGGDLTGTYPNPTLVGGPLSLYAPLASPVFTGTVQAPVVWGTSYHYGGLYLVEGASYPQIKFSATGNGADLKWWWITHDPTGVLTYQSINDAQNAVLGQINFNRDGTMQVAQPAAADSSTKVATTNFVKVAGATATHVRNAMGANVAITVVNTSVNGPNTGAIGANGDKWLVQGNFYIDSTGGTLDFYACEIWNGSSVVASAIVTAQSGEKAVAAISWIATLTAATTFTLRVKNTTAGRGTFNLDSHITAVRLG